MHLNEEHAMIFVKFRKRSEADIDLEVSSSFIFGVIVTEYNYITSYYIEMCLYTHTHIQYLGLWIFSLNHLEFQCGEEEFWARISNEHLHIHRKFPTGILWTKLKFQHYWN